MSKSITESKRIGRLIVKHTGMSDRMRFKDAGPATPAHWATNLANAERTVETLEIAGGTILTTYLDAPAPKATRATSVQLPPPPLVHYPPSPSILERGGHGRELLPASR